MLFIPLQMLFQMSCIPMLMLSSLSFKCLRLLQIMSLQSLHMRPMQTLKMLLSLQSKMRIPLQIPMQSQMLFAESCLQSAVTFLLLKKLMRENIFWKNKKTKNINWWWLWILERFVYNYLFLLQPNIFFFNLTNIIISYLLNFF